MQWNIRRRKTRSERLRETSCCDEWRYGDVAMADLVIVFSETSGILISHFYERVFTLPSHFMRESHPSMATCAPYAPLKKRRHSAMKSPPSSEHGIAHPVKTWPSSLVSRFPHFLKKQFYPISALFRIPSGTVLTARLHQTPIPTILQINGKTSRGDPAGLRNGGQARSAASLPASRSLTHFSSESPRSNSLRRPSMSSSCLFNHSSSKSAGTSWKLLPASGQIQWICHQFLPFDHVSRHGMLQLILS